MEKQFVSQELALKLKKLGFNELCLAAFSNITKDFQFLNEAKRNSDFAKLVSTAPLWQQVFDFFEEKFKFSSSIQLKNTSHLDKNYEIVIINFADNINDETTFRKDGFKNPLEAKSYCINLLIQFCS